MIVVPEGHSTIQTEDELATGTVPALVASQGFCYKPDSLDTRVVNGARSVQEEPVDASSLGVKRVELPVVDGVPLRNERRHEDGGHALAGVEGRSY